LPGDPPKKWTTPAPNSIDQNGLLTAGPSPGNYKLRGENANDPSQFAEATVTITADPGSFRADQNISTRVAARDPFTDVPLFPEERLQSDNGLSTSPPLPLEIENTGTYHNT